MPRPDYDDSTAGSGDSDDDEMGTNLSALYGTGDDTLGHLTHGDDANFNSSIGIFTEGKNGPA
ncbi:MULTISPECIES: hypothetical protein [unclassified Rathayibacter]|uniref:hypothetical protein n=1 Tax=unclassified Rathayibacter TaxID=2609250 RepID=UPI000CE84F57|nr:MULTISPECIES: hypothetical protein [unclassified Rathayibacter]PPG02121.1 hypothetical protein C5C26_15305 [Rathayibacter sp. AY2B1]PPG66587.1 hypothetical protein C5C59_16080 [Rathayibacter sp. AY1F4]